MFLEDYEVSGPEEIELDIVASSFLILETDYREFIATKRLGKANITDFADRPGIEQGIVVGRLQHDKLIPFNRCNIPKRRLEWVTE